jgi:3-hydroxyanthranilate 3,4-dioxygenase
MPPLKAFNLATWIDSHRQHLRPPVCNRQVFMDSDFIVMVVGGPNSRSDYHDDPGDELFYQLQGEMLLKTMQGGQPVDVPIRQGEMLLLPRHIPHSPQRFADTVGLVVERQRTRDECDGFLWYCVQCHSELHSEYLHVSDLVTQLPPVFARFYAQPAQRRCKRCGCANDELVPNPS